MGGSASKSFKGPYSIAISEAKQGETSIYRHPQYLQEFHSIPQSGCRTLFETVIHAFEKYPDNQFLGTRDGTEYKWKTYKEIQELATAFGSGLIKKGLVVREDHNGQEIAFMGIQMTNRQEWIVAELACILYKIVMVPLYETLGVQSKVHIAEQTNMKTVFIHGDLKSISTPMGNTVKNIIQLQDPSEQLKNHLGQFGFNLLGYNEIIAEGRENPQQYIPCQPDDIFTICYTSGTTGLPKGAVILHKGLVANTAGGEAIYMKPQKHFSYLPLAHIFQRSSIHLIINSGSSIGFFGGNILNIMEDIAIFKPTILAVVPRILNKIYDKIQHNISILPIKKAAFFKKAVSDKLKRFQTAGDPKHWIYDMLIFNKIKQILGGNVQTIGCGSAPISAEVFNFLRVCFCCQMIQGYGQTETCTGGLRTPQGDPISGHLGSPTTNIEIKLVDIPEMDYTSKDLDQEGNSRPRGEICLRGPTIFREYFKMPEETKSTIDQEGWNHTGDVGMILPGNSFKIIDRKKNIFKLAQGEYVAPQKIENFYVQSSLVGSAFVYGDSLQSYLVGIVVPDQEVVQKWAVDNGVEGSWEEICQNQRVMGLILEDMTRIGKERGLFGFEQVKKIHLHPEILTPQSGLLTPTMKYKRNDMKIHFQSIIDTLYSD